MVKSWFLTERLGRASVCIVVMAFVILYAGISWSSEEYRSWPGEFLRMGAGARAMGMGNAYTAVEGDVFCSYFNPAGLASMTQSQFALSIHYLSMDRRFMHLVYGRRIGPDADFAISWLQSGTDDIIGRDLNGKPTGSLEDKRNAFSITFSKNATKWLAFGLNTKLSLWKLGGEDAKAYGFDVGAILRPVDRLSLSFVLRDINSRYKWKTERWDSFIMGADGQPLEKEDEFPVYYTVGCAYKAFADKLLVSTTLESVEDNPIGLNLGVSYAYNDRFTLRTGVYNYTSSDKMEAGSFTYGFSIRVTRSINFDYAYVPDDFEDDSVHIISMVMGYGE